jgi:hypothetical protein
VRRRPVSPKLESVDPPPPHPRERALSIGRWNVSWLLPAALLVAITVGDWNTEPGFRVITWIVLVPGIAAALCGVRTTVFFAVASAVT